MSAGLVQTYRAFTFNNAWAITAAKLSQEDFEAKRTSFSFCNYFIFQR